MLSAPLPFRHVFTAEDDLANPETMRTLYEAFSERYEAVYEFPMPSFDDWLRDGDRVKMGQWLEYAATGTVAEWLRLGELTHWLTYSSPNGSLFGSDARNSGYVLSTDADGNPFEDPSKAFRLEPGHFYPLPRYVGTEFGPNDFPAHHPPVAEYPREIWRLDLPGEAGQVARLIRRDGTGNFRDWNPVNTPGPYYQNVSLGTITRIVGSAWETPADQRRMSGHLFRHDGQAWVGAEELTRPDVVRARRHPLRGDYLTHHLPNWIAACLQSLRWTVSVLSAARSHRYESSSSDDYDSLPGSMPLREGRSLSLPADVRSVERSNVGDPTPGALRDWTRAEDLGAAAWEHCRLPDPSLPTDGRDHAHTAQYLFNREEDRFNNFDPPMQARHSPLVQQVSAPPFAYMSRFRAGGPGSYSSQQVRRGRPRATVTSLTDGALPEADIIATAWKAVVTNGDYAFHDLGTGWQEGETRVIRTVRPADWTPVEFDFLNALSQTRRNTLLDRNVPDGRRFEWVGEHVVEDLSSIPWLPCEPGKGLALGFRGYQVNRWDVPGGFRHQ